MATLRIFLCLAPFLVNNVNAESPPSDFNIIEQHYAEVNQKILDQYDYPPSLNSENDGVVLRLRKDQDFTIRRPVIRETSPLRVQESLNALESSILSKATATYTDMVSASVTASVKTAVETTVAYVQPMRDRAISLEDDADTLQVLVKDNQRDVLGSLNHSLESFHTDIIATIEDLRVSTEKDVTASLSQVNDSIHAAQGMLGKVLTNADTLACSDDTKGTLRLKDELLEGCDGSDWKAVGGDSKHTYIQWGNNECSGTSNGVQKIYSGYAWGGHHDHRGGADPVCLRSGGGYNGGKNDGDDSANLLYPLRTEGPGPSNGAVNPGYLIRCAKCVVERNCYLEIGLNSCGSSDYEPMYSGSTYGGYHGHISNNARICLDRAGRYDNGGSHGAYLYPSKTKGTFDGRNSEAFLKCHVCCEK